VFLINIAVQQVVVLDKTNNFCLFDWTFIALEKYGNKVFI
jgi:hypothetical protein